MLKALNLPNSEITDQSKTFMTKGGAQALIVWAPQWNHLEPQFGQIDESLWQPLDDSIAWAHGKLQTLIAVPTGLPPWLTEWNNDAMTRWSYYISSIFRRHPNTPTIVLNEPDYAKVPAAISAELIKIATIQAYQTGQSHILGPATATAPYAINVLRHLRGWKPPRSVKVSFAHHHYIDVTRGSTLAARSVLAAMKFFNWQDGQKLWLTEGGYIYSTYQDPNPDYGADPKTWHYKDLAYDERVQLANVIKHFNWAKKDKRVELWANYEYQDSLWGGWASGLIRYDGTNHPLRNRWIGL